MTAMDKDQPMEPMWVEMPPEVVSWCQWVATSLLLTPPQDQKDLALGIGIAY